MTSPLELFRDWSALPNLAALHTETTGFRGQVVELALIDAAGETLFHDRIRPLCPVEPGAQDFHGIGDADLTDAPTIAEVWPELAPLLTRHEIVIYNAEFNVQALGVSLDAAIPPDWRHREADAGTRRGIQRFSLPYLQFFEFSELAHCAMSAYIPVYDNRQSFLNHPKPAKFTAACEREGVETADLPGINTALGSAHRTLRLVEAIAARAGAEAATL